MKRIYNKFKGYTLEDCDCRYCLYYGGRRKGKVTCLSDECVCADEIRQAKNEKKGVPKWKSKSTEKSGITQKRCFSDCHCGSSFFCLCLRGGGGHLFLLKPYVGTETVSWMCILGAAPFAALGFVKYNGMTAEKFIYAWIKSEFLMPKKLTFRSTNTYYELFKPSIEAKAKEAMKSND